MKNGRPDWDSYFMGIARIVAQRSTCLRRNVGALIVKGKRILATGYNGAPSGLTHCMDLSCLREQMKIAPGERHELCRGLHAEQNAIIQAAFHGVSINGADLYCTHLPCSICIKMLINAGIKKVFYVDGYPDDLSMKLIDESTIVLQKVVLNSAENVTPASRLKKAKSKRPGVKRQPRANKGV
ncbi:MAG TPA: cytidine/deoxycytidylate deaminase family protein [Syntrophorhabdaceae bacterium]|nr:cytidine/deoxycytidylate deaminase family protein [Syntrophorhabdaceae bacterium]